MWPKSTNTKKKIKCPCCNGRGIVPIPNTRGAKKGKICNSCNGQRVIRCTL